MKKVFLLMLFAVIGLESMAATITSNVTGTSGSPAAWATGSNWVGGTAPTAADNVVIAAGAFITTGSITRNSGTTTVVDGTLISTGTITLTGTMSVSNGGTFVHNSAVLTIPTATWATGSTLEIRWTATSGTFVAGTSGLGQSFYNVKFNCASLTSNLVCAGALTTVNGDLTVVSTNTGNIRLGQAETYTLNIGGDLNVNAGTINLITAAGGNAKVNTTGSVNVTGGVLGLASGGASVTRLNIGGNFNVSGGNVSPGGANAVIDTVNILGTKSGTTGTFNMTGGTFLGTSGSVIVFNIAGDMLINSGAFTMNFGNSVATPVATFNVNGTNAGATGKLVISGSGSLVSTSTGGFAISTKDSFVTRGTAVFTGNTGTSSGKSYTFNVGGSFNIGSGTTFTMSNTSATGNSLNFTGGSASASFTNNGTFTNTGLTTISVASGKTLTLNSDLTIGKAGSVTTDVSVLGTLDCATNKVAAGSGAGTFTLGASGTLKIGDANGITSAASTGSIQCTGTRTFPTTANYEYNGTATQVTGNQLPATVNKLTINNTGGTSGLTLTSALTVSDTLFLTSGNLTLGANNLTLTQTKPVTGTLGTSKHIVTNSTGKVISTYGSAAYTFPIGNSNSLYSPIVVTNSGASQTYTIGTSSTAYSPSSDALPWSWSVAASGSSSTSLAFGWTSGDAGAGLGASPANGSAYRYNGTAWTSQGGSTTTGSPNTTSVSGITSFTNTLWTVAYPNTPALNVSTSSLSFSPTISGTSSVSQSFTLDGSLFTTATGNITVSAPNTNFEVSTDDITFNSSVLLPYTSSTLSSTTIYVRFSPQSAGSFSGNVTFSGGGVSSTPTVAVSGTGNNNVNYYNVAGTDVTIASNWGTNTNGSGSQPTDFVTDGQLFNLRNAGATMSGTWTVSGSSSKVIVGNGSTYTFAATSDIVGTVDVANNATLQLSANTVTTTLGTLSAGSTVEYAAASGSQNVVATSYANLTLSGGGTRTFGTTTNISGTFNPGSGFSATSGTIVLNGTSSSQVIPAFNYNGLTVSGVDGKSTSGIINVTSALTMNNSFTVASGSTLNIDSTVTLSTTINKVLTVNGTLQKTYTYNSVTFSAGNGSITVAAGGTFKVTGYASGNGTLVFTNVNFTSGVGAAGSTLYIAATGVPRIPASPTTFNGNVVWDVPTQIGNAVFINATPFTISGNLTVVSTGAGQISNGSGSAGRTLTIGGDLIMQGGRYDISGALSPSGATASSTTVNGNVTLNGATDTLFVASSTAATTSNNLFIKGNLTHTAGVFGKLSGATNSATITFNGSASQDINSLGVINGANVVLNNSKGVRLVADFSTSGSFTFTSGKLRTNGYNFTFGPTATVSGASSTNYIALCDASNTPSSTGGVIAQSVGSTGSRSSFVFPIGADTSTYNPVTIANSIAAVDFTARVNKTAISGVTAANSVQRTWNIQASGSAAAVLTMQWAASEEGASFTRNSAAVVHYNGSIIDTASNGGISAGSDPYTFGSGATEFTSFGDFGISNGTIQPASPPTAQVSSLGFSNASNGLSSTISWTKPSGAGTNTLVVISAVGAVGTNPTDQVSYTDGLSVFGAGSAIGGTNYVVYNSTGTSVVVTGLTPGTTYNVALFSFNGNAGTENYLTPALTGSTTMPQTVYTWVGGASTGNITNQANWSTLGVGGAPVGSSGTITFTTYDKLVWDGSFSTVDTLTAGLTVGQIEIKNGATVTLASTTTRAVSLSGAGGTDLLVAASSSLILGNAAGSSATSVATVTMTLASGATASISGTVSIGNAISGSSPGNHFLTASSAGAITFNSGSTCIYNLSSTIYPFGTTTAGSVIFTNGSTLRGYKGNDIFGGNGVVTFQTGSTYEYAGSSNSFVPFGNTGSTLTAAQTFSNFVFNATAAMTPAFTVGVTMDSLIVASTSVGTVTLKATNGLNIKGNITNRSTTNALVFDLGATGTANVNMVGTTAQSILNAGGGITFGSATAARVMVLNINNAAGVTIGKAGFTGNITNLASHTLTLTSGTLNIGTTTYTLAGAINRDGTTTTGTITTSGNDTINVTGPATLPSGLFTSNAVRNITINRAAGVTLGSNLTVNGQLALTAGVLSTGSNILTLASTGSSVRTSGWVNGNYRKNVATGSNVVRTFEVGDGSNYTPISYTFASVTTAGDMSVAVATGVSGEANYGTYPLSTSAYLNRYWAVSSLNTLAFTSYSATVNYLSGDLIGGATASTIKTGVYSGGWVTYSTTSGTNTNTASNVTTMGDVLLGNCVSSVTPSVSITTSSTAVCSGGSATFTATPTNGGNAPTYQWRKNGTNISGATNTTLVVLESEATTGDVFTCVMTANNACQTSATATSNSITLSVGNVTPSVSISTATDTVCSGNNVTFTASGTNAGTAPIYTWYKNGSSVGTGSTITFTANTLSTGNVISCILTANNACQTTATANSNTRTLYVKASPAIGTTTGFTTCSLGSTIGIYNTNTQGGGVWSSSNTGVATVTTASNGGTGLVVPVGNGTSVLSYTKTSSNGCVSIASANVIVAVKATPAAITGTNSICKGSTTQLSNDTAGGVWSISPSSYASINSTGLVTSTSAGVATVKYTVTNASGCSANRTYTVTVNAFPLLPTIGYQTGTNNPQIGAGGGNFCANRTFTVVGSPSGGVWSKTGVISVTTPGGLVSTGSIAGAGSLTYTYTNSNGCSSSRTIAGNVVVCASRGVNGASSEQLVASGEFTMYPNPAKSFISLSVKNLIGTGSIVVTDLYGKQVKTQALSIGNNTMDIATLSKGIYMVSVITSEGKTTKKLVVE